MTQAGELFDPRGIMHILMRNKIIIFRKIFRFVDSVC